jgi:glycosyltransferase involved in cell wall biosynthesis
MVNDYPLETGWGAERHIARLTDALRATGDDVALFTAAARHRGAARVFDVWDPVARRSLRERISRWRPDVVNYHNVQRELSSAVFGVVAGVPAVLSVHDHRLLGVAEGADPGRPAVAALKRAKAAFERSRARRFMDAVTAPSEDLVRRLRDDGFRDATLVRYFADAGPDPATPPSATEDIVFVGRVDADKGILQLVAAFEDIASRRPAARLLIGGEGDERARIPARLSSQAAARVELLGRLTPEAVRDLMARARDLRPVAEERGRADRRDRGGARRPARRRERRPRVARACPRGAVR